MQEEGPSGEQETEFVLLQDDETDAEPTNVELGEIIQEQQSMIENLSLDLDRAKWNVQYLEQRNKKIEDRLAEIELQMIKEKWQHIMVAQGRPMEQRDEDREYVLEKVNVHLEQWLDKANREKDMLRCMTHHFMARNMSSKARIRSLKARLSKATKEVKEAKEAEEQDQI